MFNTEGSRKSLQQIISYTTPVLHTGNSWYIDFKIYDPIDEKMKRKKYMLDRIKKVSDRKKYANELIANISYFLS